MRPTTPASWPTWRGSSGAPTPWSTTWRAPSPATARYGPRLRRAVERVEAGDGEWFTKPSLPSYHSVWFELHEDLLSTLGLDRSAESPSGGADEDADTAAGAGAPAGR